MITQGKWDVIIESESGLATLFVKCDIGDNMEFIDICELNMDDDSEAKANARLIAAAPDLLAICIKLYATFENYDYKDIPAPIFNLIQNQVEQAIALAEGK